MTSTRWALWVQGRFRTRISLVDGVEEPLAELEPRASWFRRAAGGRAQARDGRAWDVTIVADRVEVREGAVVHVAVEGDELRTGDARLAWEAAWDGSRRASVRGPNGAELLRVRPGAGHDPPWLVIDLDPALPSPLPVVLAAAFVLLRADAVMIGTALNSGDGGGGP